MHSKWPCILFNCKFNSVFFFDAIVIYISVYFAFYRQHFEIWLLEGEILVCVLSRSFETSFRRQNTIYTKSMNVMLMLMMMMYDVWYVCKIILLFYDHRSRYSIILNKSTQFNVDCSIKSPWTVQCTAYAVQRCEADACCECLRLGFSCIGWCRHCRHRHHHYLSRQ